MRKLVLVSSMLLLAACNSEQSSPTPPVAEPAPQQGAAAPPTETTAPTATKPQELKSPLPEGFVLPFAYHRLYDNTGKTEAGAPQRRVMVEFIGADAGEATTALASALAEKGFAETTREQIDGKDQIVFERADGVSVIVKIDAQPVRLRSDDARGTLHLVWNSV